MKSRFLLAALALLLAVTAASAEVERAVLVREAVMHLSPGADSPKLGEVWRGREVAILDRSGEWMQVLTTLEESREATGWILAKGVIRTSTPKGDRIVFGAAAESEAEASRRGGRKRAADDAMRLYYRVYEYFPKSHLAGEALYRAADIRWQLDRADVMSRPSAKEGDPRLRGEIDERWLKQLKKDFPGTRWEALADYLMIDNDTCGDYAGKPKCAEKEAELYEKHVKKYPSSPKAAEALYRAAYAWAAAAEMHQGQGDRGDAEKDRARARDAAARVQASYNDTDWAYRAARLDYMLENGIAVYTTQVD